MTQTRISCHGPITVRLSTTADYPLLWSLFFDTIRRVNCRDYSQAQIEAWAPDQFDRRLWQQKMEAIRPVVAELNGVIAGYSDLQPDGLIDHFFCHADYQGMGVGRALMCHILAEAKRCNISRCYSEVSLTARPFYQHFGFEVVRQQQVTIRGQLLTNFLMQKEISAD